jgi:hypothetical protein
MFLRPQHFQQQDRALQRLVEGRVAGLRPYDWGFLELELEQEGLALGRIGLRSCRAILPDGTPVYMPEELPAPPPLAVDGALRDQLVCLALPLRRVGQAEVSRNGESTDTARYSAVEEEVRDGNLDGSGSAQIEICREALRLLPESADLGPYAAIGVCRVTQVQPDGTVQLDPAYIPPMLDCSASAGLAAIVSELNGKLRQTASALAERVSLSRQQASDLSSFLRLWGGLTTDLQMRVFDVPGVWAAGDCVESIDLVSGNRVHVALGTHANKQGRVLGTNLGGGYATFPGVVGTAVSKVCDLEIARTGLRERDCEAVGFAYVTVSVDSTTRAGYFPGAAPVTVKLVVERRTGRLLGGQIVGRQDAAKRVDVLAVALWNRMTVEEISSLDLGYAPPFSPVWDPVLIAARKAADAVRAG